MAGAVGKTFDVLEALVEHNRLAQIAVATGLPKATVHRILQVMVARGLARPIWLALIIAGGIGFAPMIAVQPAFYAELFGAGVRYTGFAASREIGAAISGFSPLVAAFLLREEAGGEPWLVAAWIILTAAVSLVAFLAA